MIDHLGWDNLQQRRLLHQATMFYKIHQGLVGVSLTDDVCPLTRASRLPIISVLTAKFSRVSMYISFHFNQEQSLPGITSHLTIFANQPQVSKHLPCLQLSHLIAN
jgi:hypothetical protein